MPRSGRTDGRAPRVNSYSASPLRLTHLVGGEKISGGSAAVSRNPSDVAEIVAEHPIGDADLLDAAIAAAHEAQAGWAAASPEFRSGTIGRTAWRGRGGTQ